MKDEKLEADELETNESGSNEPESMDIFEIEESNDSGESDIYTEEGMESYMDEDGISPSEEGFMVGYLGG